jgi:hypothetical protein
MAADEAREALADQLLDLPTPELVDVLRRVLPARASSHNGLTSRLVLAEVTRVNGGVPGQEGANVAVVAWPDRDYYDGGFGPEPELWEQGTCTGCGLDVVSSAKRAMCPVCATRCQRT